jgi:putative effector of murein hydrolase
MVFPLILSLLVGTLVASLSALLIAHTLGASTATLASLAPKSVTTPIAMGISEKLGGLPSLTAVLVLLTGMVGAIFGPALFKRLSVRDDAIKGVALGVAAHGIGTARAFQLSDAAGAFAGLAMGLTALLSALLLPFLAPWVLQHLAR